jgi:hypothetical protein
VPFICANSGWTWLSVARRLSLLAPRLAPRNLVSLANVRTDRTQYRPEIGLTTQRDGRIRENARRAAAMSGSGLRCLTDWRACRSGESAALAQMIPSLLAGRPWPDRATWHLLDSNRARGHDRIACGKGLHLLFIVGLHDTRAPGAAGVEHGTEDHHLASRDPGRQCSAWRAMISRPMML